MGIGAAPRPSTRLNLGWMWKPALRTNNPSRKVAQGTNALATAVIHVCRSRAEDAPVIGRREFVAALKRELPRAVRSLQQDNISPVDLAQAIIGPGMAIFSRHARVLEADGSAMSVGAALQEINRVFDEAVAGPIGTWMSRHDSVSLGTSSTVSTKGAPAK